MYVTKKTLARNDLAVGEIKTGFCWRSTFNRKLNTILDARANEAMKLEARGALNAIDAEIKSLINTRALPQGARTSVRGWVGEEKSCAIGYIEKENGIEYLVMQINIVRGTPEKPSGEISASVYWGDFNREFIRDKLDNLPDVKAKIIAKLLAFKRAWAGIELPKHSNMDMASAEGFI